MRRRLDYLRRVTLKSMTPEDQEDTLERGLEMQEEYQKDLTDSSEELTRQQERVEEISLRISTIQDEIENLSMAGGNQNVQLRMNYAVKQSELTSSRKEIHQHLMGAMPFVVAGLNEHSVGWGLKG